MGLEESFTTTTKAGNHSDIWGLGEGTGTEELCRQIRDNLAYRCAGVCRNLWLGSCPPDPVTRSNGSLSGSGWKCSCNWKIYALSVLNSCELRTFRTLLLARTSWTLFQITDCQLKFGPSKHFGVAPLWLTVDLELILTFLNFLLIFPNFATMLYSNFSVINNVLCQAFVANAKKELGSC